MKALIIVASLILFGCAPTQPRPADVYECAGGVLFYCLPGRVKAGCEPQGRVQTLEPRNACENRNP